MSIKGYPSQKKTGDQQYATLQPVGQDSHGLDVVSHGFAQEIATDAVEAGSTTTVIVATAHSARRGDLIYFESGTLTKQSYPVLSVETNAITVAVAMPVAPSAADAFSVRRYTAPLVDANGELIVGVTFSNDTDYGAAGANTLRTASQIGNATGAANFGTGVIGAQTLRVGLASDQLSTLATEVTLATLATEATLADVDASLTSLAGEDFATEATLAAAAADLASIAAEDFATQTTLAAINAKTPSFGNTLMAGSVPVTMAADQSAIAVSDGGGSLTVDGAILTSIDSRLTVANIAYTAKGKIAGTALTASYATLLNPTSDLRILVILNSCDQTILVSLDGGTTDSLELEAGESLALDLGENGLKFDNTVNVSAKHGGVVPTSGTVRASGVG